MACNTQSKNESAENAQASKCLVLYYSQTGITKAVAEELQKALGADIEAVEAVDPYSGTYDETIQRCLKEQQEGVTPAVKPLKSNLSEYDTVFIGFPVWFGTYASPIATMLAENDFAGKKIVPFCTYGSGGLEPSVADIAKAQPKAEVCEGYGVRSIRLDAMPAEVNRFLIENGYIDGTVEPLPDFSEQQPVTAAETAIFDAACGDYMFPLGTAVTAAHRDIDGGTEYKFIAAAKTPDGRDAENTIYVLDIKGHKPIFTRVVR